MKTTLKILPLLLFANLQPANAQTITWFQNHNAERQQAIRRCRDDYRFHMGENAALCANAEAAQTRLGSGRFAQGAFNEMDTPEWWQRNPSLRASVQAACQRRASYDASVLRYCRVAGDGQR